MNDVLVTYKRSTYDFWSHSPDIETRKFARSDHPQAVKLRHSNEALHHALETVRSVLDKQNIRYDFMHRAELTDVVNRRLLVAVGGDGTVLNSAHYVLDTPVLGVKPTNSSIGFYCCCGPEDFERVLGDIDSMPRTTTNRMQVTQDGLSVDELAANDVLFTHVRDPAMCRYELVADGMVDPVGRADRLLVSTGGGSTAWIHQYGGALRPFDDNHFQYLPFGVLGAKPKLAKSLKLVSYTREGMFYIDGEHVSYNCGLASELEFSLGHPLTLIGDLKTKQEAYKPK